MTLIQTGKSNVVPIVLLEGTGGVYWEHWKTYVVKNLLDNGWISPEDLSLMHMAKSPEDACEHILAFYRVFHSYRYVDENLVFRLNHELTPEQIDELNDEFKDLVRSGRIEQTRALSAEQDHLELPRIVFHHTRRAWGRVRQLIDRINDFGVEES